MPYFQFRGICLPLLVAVAGANDIQGPPIQGVQAFWWPSDSLAHGSGRAAIWGAWDRFDEPPLFSGQLLTHLELFTHNYGGGRPIATRATSPRAPVVNGAGRGSKQPSPKKGGG